MAGLPPTAHEPARGQLFCGVDIGASATKVVLIDDQLEAVGEVVEGHDIDTEQVACADHIAAPGP